MAISEVRHDQTADNLADNLRKLSRRVAQLEDILRGVGGALHSISSGGFLADLPRDEPFRADHLAATGMLEMIEVAIDNFDERYRHLNSASSDIDDLADAAEHGTLMFESEGRT